MDSTGKLPIAQQHNEGENKLAASSLKFSAVQYTLKFAVSAGPAKTRAKSTPSHGEEWRKKCSTP